jgi:hypothetical protein
VTYRDVWCGGDPFTSVPKSGNRVHECAVHECAASVRRVRLWLHGKRACGCIATVPVVALQPCLWLHCNRVCGCIATVPVVALQPCLWLRCNRACNCIPTVPVVALQPCLWLHCNRACGCIATVPVVALQPCVTCGVVEIRSRVCQKVATVFTSVPFTSVPRVCNESRSRVCRVRERATSRVHERSAVRPERTRLARVWRSQEKCCRRANLVQESGEQTVRERKAMLVRHPPQNTSVS